MSTLCLKVLKSKISHNPLKEGGSLFIRSPHYSLLKGPNQAKTLNSKALNALNKTKTI